ncbi:MAG: HEAT repeat domain-containing protein [Planctomycetota bacterium]
MKTGFIWGVIVMLIVAACAVMTVGRAKEHPKTQVMEIKILPSNISPTTRQGVAGAPAVNGQITKVRVLAYSPDEAARGSAVQVLLRLGAPAAMPELIRLMAAPYSDVREDAFNAISQLQSRDPKPIPDVIESLSDPDALVRSLAICRLRVLQANQAIPEFIRLLSDPDAGVRRLAVEALGKFQATDATPDVIKLLSDPDADVRTYTVGTLRELQAQEAVPELIKSLSDAEAKVRRASVEALLRLNAKQAIPIFISLLSDPDRGVRRWSATALGELNAQQAIPDIIKLLSDPEAYVRQWSVYALLDLKARQAIPDITGLLKDPDSEVRRFADYVLDQLGAAKTSPTAYIEGEIIAVSEKADLNLVIINVGKNDGVEAGMKFIVYGDGKYIGKIQVEKVEDHISIAVSIKGSLTDGIKVGYSVVTSPD